jgi:ribosome-binding factor A
MRRHQDSRGVASYPRTVRVNRVLQEVLADSLERLADADERLRMATVTAVDTAPDLRQATVFLSSLDDAVAEALAEHRVVLQRAIANEVRLKRTPHLEFAADPAVVAGSRVEEILRRIHGSTEDRRDPSVPESSGPDASGDERGDGRR